MEIRCLHKSYSGVNVIERAQILIFNSFVELKKNLAQQIDLELDAGFCLLKNHRCHICFIVLNNVLCLPPTHWKRDGMPGLTGEHCILHPSKETASFLFIFIFLIIPKVANESQVSSMDTCAIPKG